MIKVPKNKICYFLFPFVALMSPVVANLNGIFDTLLSKESYITSSIPIWIFVFGLSVLCFLLGILCVYVDALAQKRGGRVLKYFLISGVIFLALDLSYGGIQIAENLMPFGKEFYALRVFKVVFALVIFSILFGLVRFLSAKLPIILVAIFGSFFISSLILCLFPAGNNEKNNHRPRSLDITKPPIIHMILDEMIGAEGIDRSIPEGEQTYQLIRNFHDRFNFRLYGKAFSRHFWTGMSVPNMMNYDYTDATYGTQSRYVGESKWRVFDDMQKRGYWINIYQSLHLDFCSANNINICNTFNSFNPASIYFSAPRDYSSQELPVGKIVLRVFLQRVSGSYLARLINRIIKRIDNDLYLAERFDVQSFTLWFDKFQNDVVQTKGGEIYFSHFLVPHAPFLLDKDCNNKPISWLEPHHLKEVKNLAGQEFKEARKFYNIMYYEQVSCIYKKLTGFMESIEQLDRFKNATIVINGDHGSRISSGQFVENLTDQDFVDNYSAHFSIRSPQVNPGYDLRSVSVQRLYAETFQLEAGLKMSSERDLVVANSMDKGRIVLVPMPEFGIPNSD